MSREMRDSGIEWIGEIPLNWDVVKTKSIFKIFSGATPSSSEASFWDGNITWITPSDFKTKDRWVHDSKRLITDKGYKSCGTTLVPRGSIIISNRAPIGSVALAGLELCTNQGCKSLVRINESLSTMFYYFYYSIMDNPLNMLGRGTTFLELSTNSLSDFYIPLPSKNVMKSIGEYLEEKVRKIDEILEQTKSTIEDYKLLKQSIITEAVTKGLDKNVEMKDSGIEWVGTMPAHWDKLRGKVILNKLSRPILDSDTVVTCFRDGEVTLRSNRREDGFTMADKEIGYQGVEPQDLVVHGMDGFAGAIGISDSRGKSSPVLNVLDSKQNKKYLMYYLRSMAYSDVFLALATGIRVRSCDLRWNKIGDLPYPVPPLDEQEEIVEHIDNKLIQINEVIERKQGLLEQLETYKKSLIYEYVTGKKEVE